MPKPQDVDAYIAAAPAESRPILEELRKIVLSTLPKVDEKIAWGVPIYRYHGEIGGYAAYKKHVSVGLGADVMDGATATHSKRRATRSSRTPFRSRSTRRCRPR